MNRGGRRPVLRPWIRSDEVRGRHYEDCNTTQLGCLAIQNNNNLLH